jgi:hypothetical protein
MLESLPCMQWLVANPSAVARRDHLHSGHPKLPGDPSGRRCHKLPGDLRRGRSRRVEPVTAWRSSTMTRVRDSSSCQRRPRSWTHTDTAPTCSYVSLSGSEVLGIPRTVQRGEAHTPWPPAGEFLAGVRTLLAGVRGRPRGGGRTCCGSDPPGSHRRSDDPLRARPDPQPIFELVA